MNFYERTFNKNRENRYRTVGFGIGLLWFTGTMAQVVENENLIPIKSTVPIHCSPAARYFGKWGLGKVVGGMQEEGAE